MKIGIYRDERWPDYGFVPIGRGEADVEISEELWDQYTAANEAYNEVQRILRDLYVLAKPPEQKLPRSEGKNIQFFRYEKLTTVPPAEKETAIS